MRSAIAQRFGAGVPAGEAELLQEQGRRAGSARSDPPDRHRAAARKRCSGHLTHDQFALYKMVYERFMASQMRPVEFETTSLEVRGGPYLFRSSSTVVVFKGFLALYGEERAADEAAAPLPALPVGAPLTLDGRRRRAALHQARAALSPTPRWSRRWRTTASAAPAPTRRSSTRSSRATTSCARRSASSPRSGASSPPRC